MTATMQVDPFALTVEWAHAAPTYKAPEEPQRDHVGACGMCPKCHPGRAFKGDAHCHALKDGRTCGCHREVDE